MWQFITIMYGIHLVFSFWLVYPFLAYRSKKACGDCDMKFCFLAALLTLVSFISVPTTWISEKIAEIDSSGRINNATI